MISIICVYNDEQIASRYLFSSLKGQTVPHELIALDNKCGRFKSAAQALNFGAKQAKGDYLMFVHQDVELCSSLWLEEVEGLLNTIQDLGIAGVAGKDGQSKWVMTNIKHGFPPEEVKNAIHITTPVKVQTLDECLAIVPKRIFNKLEFDEITCDDWHAYVVDYCLSLKKLGLGAYVIPMSIYHRSRGLGPGNPVQVIRNLGYHPKEYYRAIGKILVKHGSDFGTVFTTCGDWSPRCPLLLQQLSKLARPAAFFLKRTLCRFFGLTPQG